MKKLAILFFLGFISLSSFAQTFYKATITEMYMYDRNKEEWTLYQKNSDVNITVVIEDEFISLQAKTPTMYKIYLNSKEPMNTKSLKGYRYLAKDLKEEKMVKIDVVVSEEAEMAIVSIINHNEGYNLRFYLTKIIE